MSDQKWIRNSVERLSERLKEKGIHVCGMTVYNILKRMGYSMKYSKKRRMGSRHSCPYADEQFAYIASKKAEFLGSGLPEAACRFRDYLRTVLSNLVRDHRRKKQSPAAPLEGAGPEAEDVREGEEEFIRLWREGLVRRALQALEGHEKRTGEVRYTVLRLAMDHPGMEAEEMARRLSGQLGKPATAAWVRKRVFLARQKLRDLLRHEVRQTLREPTDEAVEEELAEVGLLAYCR
jgi:DNA-directed RNA polymerase specialized sigma24 family protein